MSRAVTVLVALAATLGGCDAPQRELDAADLASHAAPPPTPGAALTAPDPVSGRMLRAHATGLPPGRAAVLLMGWSGYGDGPCPPHAPPSACASLLGPPRMVARTTVTATGEARFRLAASPARLPPGRRLGLQVIVPAGAATVVTPAVEVTVRSGGPGLTHRPSNPSCVAPPRPPTGGTATLERRFADVELDTPTALIATPDGAAWYAAELDGTIVRFDNDDDATGTVAAQLTDLVSSGELGLLSIALHPDFLENGELFAYGTRRPASAPVSRIERLTSVDGGLTFPVGVAHDTLLEVPQPFNNHNGGTLQFGPDRMLWFGFGDGGSANDPGNRAQDPSTLLGKFIRIDVDAAYPYGIPADNPFPDGASALAEIWAFGFRNPFRWSFDRETGAAWIGDVGQDAREEIDVLRRGGNYGWRMLEGTRCSNPPGCDDPTLIPPVAEYAHGAGPRSVVGGYVYRGDALPHLDGIYLYADFYLGQVLGLFPTATGALVPSLVVDTGGLQISSFAEDAEGELYLLDYAGGIHAIVPDEDPPDVAFPTRLSDTGCVQSRDATQPSLGLVPYAPRVELWSDGLDKQRWLALPDGAQIDVEADGDWSLPVGSVLVKEFADHGRPIETRLLTRHADGGWGTYSYVWNQEGTDALWAPGGAEVTLADGRRWAVPSQADCRACHTAAAGTTLGLESAQLDHVIDYGGTWAHQLNTLAHAGLVASPAPTSQGVDALPRLQGPDTAESRARAYLHANCASCHQPGGGTPVDMDLRYDTPLADARLCGVAPTAGDLGVTGALRLTPGSPLLSVLTFRMTWAGPSTRMPPLGTDVVHADAADVVDAWIASLTHCP